MKMSILAVLGILLMFISCNGKAIEKNKNSLQSINGQIVKELGSSIMIIYQDKKKVYWFGSWQSGVYQYDGKTLINYTTKNGLQNNRIDEIAEDSLGNIYFISLSPTATITKFDGQKFTNIIAKSGNEWKIQNKDIWLKNVYHSEKVFRFDGDSFYELALPKPPGFSIPFEIYSIYKDRKGNIWFGTNPVGVCRYNGQSFEWITEEDVTEFHNEGANGVRSITEDKNGDFWFNTEYRYSVYNTPQSDNKFYTRHKSIGGLDGKQNSDLDEYLSTLKDNNDNLWFVTYRNGVWKYDGKKITHYVVRDNSKEITLFSIYKDKNGVLWLGTHENGAFKFNGTDFVKFRP
jgi:ligand-binding sensor domain-containing protein